jgi:hypothetical protein
VPRSGQRRTLRAVTKPVLHPHAEGADIGATELYVCLEKANGHMGMGIPAATDLSTPMIFWEERQ